MKKSLVARSKQPARHRKNTGQFLLSKTDALPPNGAVSQLSLAAAAEVLEAFPQLLAGSAFIDYALEYLDGTGDFGVLVIKVDRSPAEAGAASENGYTADQRHIAQVIDAVCKKADGLWGQVNNGLYGCFFAAKTYSACRDLANEIQTRFRQRTAATVSIGMAGYPLLDYPKEQIMENAHKALRHTAFFGPGTCTTFDAVSLNISGDELYQNGDIRGAIREYEWGLRLDPTNANLHNSLGVCFGLLKQYDKAWAAFDTALQIDAQEMMALYNAGQVRYLQERHADALNYFLKAADLDEDAYEVAFQIGRLYLEMGNPGKSKPFLEQATRLNASLGLPFALLGRCCQALNMPEEAIAAFKKAIRRNPFDAESLSALGLLYGHKGENADIAILFCQKSIDIEPHNGQFHSRLGELHLKYGQLEEALAAFQRASGHGWDATDDIVKTQNRLTAKAS